VSGNNNRDSFFGGALNLDGLTYVKLERKEDIKTQ
jgi:hypothetical protein